MLICFNATTEAKDALDSMLGTTQFRDISEAISVALVNYVVLTKTIGVGGQIFPSIEAVQARSNCDPTLSVVPSSPQQRAVRELASAGRTAIPEIFVLKPVGLESINLLEIPQPSGEQPQNLAPAKWLFGQFNKFLAAKATCRAVLNLLVESPAGLGVVDASNKISHAACTLGDHLQRLDARLQPRREEAFAAAFPTSGGGGESRLRFGNQFVAHVRQNQLGGFPAALRLVAMDTAKAPRLSLTRAGAEFAMIQNPILDAEGAQPTHKLSQSEVEFLLSHIVAFVPEEVSAYGAIFDAIRSGFNTPDSIDKFLRKRFNLINEDAISKTFLTTQRTGVISRMADLGLIGREKKGLRVTYLTREAGSHFHLRITPK